MAPSRFRNRASWGHCCSSTRRRRSRHSPLRWQTTRRACPFPPPFRRAEHSAARRDATRSSGRRPSRAMNRSISALRVVPFGCGKDKRSDFSGTVFEKNLAPIWKPRTDPRHDPPQPVRRSRHQLRQRGYDSHSWRLASGAGGQRRAGRRTPRGGEGQPDPLSIPKRTGKPGRLPRRSAEEITQLLGKIVLLVKTKKEGMRAEEIRSAFGMQSKEMPRILSRGSRRRSSQARAGSGRRRTSPSSRP